jgi:hypothetical protein
VVVARAVFRWLAQPGRMPQRTAADLLPVDRLAARATTLGPPSSGLPPADTSR